MVLFKQEAKMKKVLFLVMVLMMIVALAGCNMAVPGVPSTVTDSTYNGTTTGPMVSNGIFGPNGTYGNNVNRGLYGNSVNGGNYATNGSTWTYGTGRNPSGKSAYPGAY